MKEWLRGIGDMAAGNAYVPEFMATCSRQSRQSECCDHSTLARRCFAYALVIARAPTEDKSESMTIKGALEHVSKAGVSGWCVDDASDAPAMVDVIVGPVRLGTVRADMSRDDIHRSLGRRLAGFRLPFTSTLFRLLPHGAGVEAVSKGIKLPFAKHQRFSIDNPGQDDAEQLLDRLNDGYVISPKSGGIFRPLKGSQLEE